MMMRTWQGLRRVFRIPGIRRVRAVHQQARRRMFGGDVIGRVDVPVGGGWLVERPRDNALPTRHLRHPASDVSNEQRSNPAVANVNSTHHQGASLHA